MGKIELRNFDGDLKALSAMAQESWFEEYGLSTWPDLYKPELAAHFFADVGDPRFLIGAYDGSRLVAFTANLPRIFRLNGKTFKAVMACLLVGHKDYRGRHIALDLISECLRRNEEIGCDFALMTLEAGHRSALMFEKHLKTHHRIERLKKMYPIVRPISIDRLAASEGLSWYETAAIKAFGAHRPLTAPFVPGKVRPFRESDLDQILALINRYPDKNALVRVFKRESLLRKLQTERVTFTMVYERDGAVKGFINWTLYDLVGPRGRNTWAWLDFLFWEGMDAREKKALLAGMWESAKENNCIAILEWNKNYYRKGPLFRSRFIAYPRFIDLNGWVFNPQVSLAGIKSVFEQQI